LEGKEIQSKTSGELSREIAKSYLLLEYMNPKIVDGVTGRPAPSKPLARYGAIWWRARERPAWQGGGRPSD
jgi:hypothetical protein